MGTNIAEPPGESSEQTQYKVQKILAEKINIRVKAAHRAAKPSEQKAPRPVIIKLSSTQEKLSCFKTSHELRGSKIFLSIIKENTEIRGDEVDFFIKKPLNCNVLNERKRRQCFGCYVHPLLMSYGRRRKRDLSVASLEISDGNALII